MSVLIFKNKIYMSDSKNKFSNFHGKKKKICRIRKTNSQIFMNLLMNSD